MAIDAGILLEITQGVHKGLFAVARTSKQLPAFSAIKKLYVEFYKDDLCQHPVVDPWNGKRVVGLIQVDYCKQIGFVD